MADRLLLENGVDALALETGVDDVLLEAIDSTDYVGQVLIDRPVAYWRMGEASGSVIDSAGSNTGTTAGTVTRDVSGALASGDDGAITFGTTGYVSVPAAAALDLGNGPYTIEAWVYMTAYAGDPNSNAIVGKGTNAYLLWVDNLGHLALSARFVDDPIFGTTAPVTLNAWHHLVAIHDGARVNKLYCDNVDLPTTLKTRIYTLNTASSLGISSEIGNVKAGVFQGKIDEVAIYKSALPADRVAAHYTAGTTVPSETHSGAGSLAATATLARTGVKAGKGTASLSSPATLAATGGRIIGGAGSLALTATLARAGRKAGQGAGALAPVATFAATAKRATSGTGALALTATFARTGVKAGKGTASLSSPATLAGVGAAVPDYPTIATPAGIGQGFNATNATSLSINPYNTTDPILPESAFNDLVSVFVAFDGNVTDAAESSGRWFADSYPDGTGSLSLWVFTAREDNSTPLRLDLTWTGSEQVAWLAFAVGNTPENVVSRAAQGLSAAPDPPLTPLVAEPLRNYLVVAIAAWDNGLRSLTGNPAGYLDSATQRTNTSTGVGIAAVWKAVQATQEDPTAYGISASDNWVALTYGYYRSIVTNDRTGTGALALTATFARTGVKAGKGTGALVASATFAATAKKAGKGTGSLALTATLVGVGRRVVVGTGSLALTATLAATGRKAAAGSGTLAASAVLVAVARKAGRGTGALALTATLVATGSKSDAGSSSLGLTATLAASGRKGGRGTGVLALTATLVGVGRRVVTGTGSLALAASLAATGTKRGQGAGSVTASATFAATATKRTSGTGTLVLVLSFATTGSAQGTGFGSGELVLSATLVATGRKAGRGAGTLALAPVLATVARTTRSGAGGTIFASAILVATGSVEDQGSSTLGLAASLTSSGTKAARTDATLDASAAASTTARKGARGAGSLALAATFASTGIAISAPKGAGALALAASLTATGRKSTSGSGALNLSATLDGRGRRTGVPEVQPPGPIRVPEIRFPVGGERRGRGHLQLNARLSAAGERRFRAGRGYLRLLVRLEPGPGWAIEDANQAAALAALLLDDAA